MSQHILSNTRSEQINTLNDSSTSDQQIVYGLGLLSIILSLVLIIIDMSMSMAAPATQADPITLSTVDWLNLLYTQPFQAIRDLGFFNILNSLLVIPVFLSLYLCHKSNKALALLALILSAVGGTIYISNNTVLPLLTLGNEYAITTSSEQKLMIETAAHTLLARGEDFTYGTLVGFIVPSIASILMAYVVLQGGIFRKMAGCAGIVGFTSLLIFTIWIVVNPAAFDTAMMLAMISGLLSLVWYILIGLGLFKLARTT